MTTKELKNQVISVADQEELLAEVGTLLHDRVGTDPDFRGLPADYLGTWRRQFHAASDGPRRALLCRLILSEAARIHHDRGASFRQKPRVTRAPANVTEGLGARAIAKGDAAKDEE
jgi:hypothetical protein